MNSRKIHLINRVLKSVILLFLRHGEVKAANKKSLRKLLLYFSQVSYVHPLEIRWDTLKYHRNNASYRMLIEVCRLTVEGLLLTTEAGEHKLVAWLQDEYMHRLYERFVLAFYKRHHPEFSPSAAHIDWDIPESEKSEYLPTMKSDIILSNGKRTIIIDMKYYGKTMQTNYERKTYISGNLYQIYAYTMNYSKGNSSSVSGLLLYAKTDEDITPDEDLIISGSRISLKTLNLNQDWKGITEQLSGICEWLKSEKTELC